MNILVITGRLAEKTIREKIKEIAKQYPEYNIKLYVLPIDVIALADQRFIEYHLSGTDLGDVDIIVIPGTLRGDYSKLSEKLGVKIVKSPSNPSLLKTMFMIGLEKFSPDRPGEEVIREYLDEIYNRAVKHYSKTVKGARLRELIIPYNPPPFITGFYMDHRWGYEWILRYISRYKPDIVYLPENIQCSIIEELVKLGYSGRLAVPESLVNKECITGYTNLVYGVKPVDAREYVDSGYIVHVYVTDQKDLGILKELDKDKIIIDLVLPGIGEHRLLQVLNKYSMLKNYAKSAWISNLLYSIDADTHAQLPLLLELLGEAGVSLIVISEFEEKLHWLLRETHVARKLLTISWYLDTDPRDLGIDLLVVKDKEYSWIEFPKPDKVVEIPVMNKPYRIDPMGIFKIRVNHIDGYIEALYIGRKGRILLRGRREEDIRRVIIEKGLISRIDHAFYLGRELGKAEEALRIGKNYEQEKPLLKNPYMDQY